MTDNRNEPIRLDRLSDRFFKYLFATEEHKDLLIAFLNEVLLDLDPDGSARRIEDVAYGDRESSPLYRDAKLPRFDVIATAEDGRIFHIEVQVAKDRHFLERSLYYSAMTYFLQLGEGDEYGDLAPVISLVYWISRCFRRLPRMEEETIIRSIAFWTYGTAGGR